jgi:hypothetical protein
VTILVRNFAHDIGVVNGVGVQAKKLGLKISFT